MNKLDLTGLTAGPAQVWGGVRLVPLLRSEPVAGLRLRAEVYGREYASVRTGPRERYVSYVPHGLVADWGPREGAGGGGAPTAVYGTQLAEAGGDGPGGCGPPVRIPLREHHRLAKRGRARSGAPEPRLRFLPLHLALEGYLSLHFRGPSVVWDAWTRRAVRRGLSPRAEAAYTGRAVPGLAEALRVFEIDPRQCGVLVYVSDALAGAFVVPHPADYRALHPSLVEDLYGELVHQYAYYGRPVAEFTASLGDGRYIRSVAELRSAAVAQERLWRERHDTLMAGRLLEPSYAFERVYALGSFTLWRFLPSFRRGEPEQHIGETITDHKGRVAYLKTFRLSEAQTGRAYLLRRLHEHDWRLDRTAEAIGTDRAELVRRLRDAGFGELLRPDAGAGR
ncbi:ARPP-2 domain-containing protein [Streptomyces yaizuensis]|uniref:ARG and Rhodanese-Phosphatase-superfamily-associated domain-containing protein n=1 Tax=Streptomyces yaizuensis TaxID=2989713 RepID=A0ABQ5NUI9_9ACTN|nr:hypothetical protein [Streptomyces sp. YSPA8]GLF94033.1 hypothetical protein SYYSPA8_07070 [Streptomyces sp. YSPA8]